MAGTTDVPQPDGPAAAVKHPMVLSVGQASFFVAYFWTLFLYLSAVSVRRQRARDGVNGRAQEQDIEAKDQAAHEGTPLVNAVQCSADKYQTTSLWEEMRSSSLARVLVLDTEAVLAAQPTLLHMLEFGTILVWFFLCDRTDLFRQGEKEYSRDLFLFLFLLLTIVAFATSVTPVRTPLLLNRPQTEEWKGWMQVLFLLYHYFEAREAYNAIRIFIAGYVWLTGFGNFSYYYRSGDFSLGRFCQMMWRLNFLVLFCCVVLQNSYMLYYICPMHTIFTVFVYAALAVAPRLNKVPAAMWAKLAGCVLLILVLWDRRVFGMLWGPFDWLVGYTDPRKPPEQDRLHEWFFRSGLDRFVWIWGMVCAYLHPVASRALAALEELPPLQRRAARGALLGVTLAACAAYYQLIYTLPKKEYNKVHPYTSWIPLTLFVVLRNLTLPLRTYSLRLFGWLGCITLETYLCQFHIWLHSDLPDGQPKHLLVLVPGYPLLNFAACTAMYVYISHRLFVLTNELKDALVPHDNNRLLARNALLMGGLGAGAWALGWVVVHTVIYRLA